MKTIDQLINGPAHPTPTDDEIKCAFNAFIRAQKQDIHDWETLIPHFVNFIEQAADKGLLVIVKYMQTRFLNERPADLIQDSKHSPINHYGTFPIRVYNSNKSHEKYNLTRAFFTAIKRGNIEIVKALLEESRFNHITIESCEVDTGKTPLMVAAEAGHLNVVKYLTEQKANLNAKNTRTTPPGKNAFDYACDNNRQDIKAYLANYATSIVSNITDNKVAPVFSHTSKKTNIDDKYAKPTETKVELPLLQQIINKIQDGVNRTSSFNIIQVTDDTISEMKKLDNADDIIKLHDFICVKLTYNRIMCGLHADFDAIIAKIAKQRILELELNARNTQHRLPFSPKTSLFLNTNRYHFGRIFSSNWYNLGGLATTQSKDIYDIIHKENDPERAKYLYDIENTKLQKSIESQQIEARDTEGCFYRHGNSDISRL